MKLVCYFAFAVCFATTIVATTEKKPEPYHFDIVVPRFAIPGQTLAVSVTISGSKAQQTDDAMVSITVTLLKGSDETRNVNSLSTVSMPKAKFGNQNLVHLRIPNSVAGVLKLRVIAVGTDGDSVLINHISSVTVRSNHKVILIQTDKPVYKPGDTVQGRVIVLRPDMSADSGNVTVHFKHHSKKFFIASFKHLTLTSGVAKFELPISPEPVLDDYVVCAERENTANGKLECFRFKVDNYVLPKFSCTVTPQDEVLPCSRPTADGHRRWRVCFTVKATYTYGQQVKGKLEASADVLSTPSYKACASKYKKAIHRKINGTTVACVEACIKYSNCQENIKLSVYVTDLSSGHKVQCKGRTRLEARRRRSKIHIDNEENTFFPCHRSTFKVQTARLTGRPASMKVHFLCRAIEKAADGTCSEQKPFHSEVLQTNKMGNVWFSFCIPCNAVQIQCKAESQDAVTESVIRNIVYSPEHISLSSIFQNVQTGELATVTAISTSPAEATFYIVSRSNLIDVHRCTPERNANYSLFCDKKEYYYCNIKVPVTTRMVPSFSILAEQKGLSVNRLTVGAYVNSQSQVRVAFEQNEAKPAETATLNISAPPGSYVGIVGVDQSVYIQQSKNQLSVDKLNERFSVSEQNSILPTRKFRCGGEWKWTCKCRRYGCLADSDAERKTEDPWAMYFNCGKCYPRVCTDNRFISKYCNFVSANSYYQALGLNAISSTDFRSNTDCIIPPKTPKPVQENDCCYSYIFERARMDTSQFLGRKASTSSSRLQNQPTSADKNGGKNTKESKLPGVKHQRSYFPETWLWTEATLGANESNIQQQFQIPHTITSWIVDAFAVSPQTPMTVSKPAQLNVFQPFFCSLHLPYSVVRGETVKIKATVYNYLQTQLQVSVRLLVDSKEISVIESKRQKTEGDVTIIEVPAGDGKTIEFNLLPLKIGKLPIQCLAQSAKAADAITKTLLVEAEGIEEEYSMSSLLCLSESESTNKIKTFRMTLPSSFVQDSERAVASFTADYMSPTINGLEKLLRLPTGCGEQNMLKFAPAVYVTRYLTAVNRLNEETRAKAMKYMLTGYQRELTFQRTDGSYSAFGEGDPCGSMWLTSFVVRSFSQADGLIEIDSQVQRSAINWIKSKRSGNTYPPVCRVLNKEMQGCTGGECSLTAYTVLALLEGGTLPEDISVSSPLSHLATQCISTSCKSTYNLALISYVLCKAGHPQAESALKSLRECATEISDHLSWSYSKQQCYKNPWLNYCSARSCDVETTAYALLAFACQGDIGSSLKIVRWLTEQRSTRGGFKSTQDTMVALQALFEYGQRTVEASQTNVEVNLKTSTGTSFSLVVNQETGMKVQEVEFNELPATLQVNVSGAGCILAQVGVKYNVPKPNDEAAFEVNATSTRQRGSRSCKIQVEVCNRWLFSDPDSSNMAITDVAIFSGFVPVSGDLKRLEKEAVCQIKRIEADGRRIRFYLDEVRGIKCCFSFGIKQDVVVKDLKSVPVLSYNYYDPDQSGGTMMKPPVKC